MIGLDSFTKQILNVWPQYEFKQSLIYLSFKNLQNYSIFSLAVFVRFIGSQMRL